MNLERNITTRLLASLLATTSLTAAAQQTNRTPLNRSPMINNQVPIQAGPQANAGRRYGPLVADLNAAAPQNRFNGTFPAIQVPQAMQAARLIDLGPQQKQQILSANGVQPAGPTGGFVSIGRDFANDLVSVSVRAEKAELVIGTSVSVPLFSDTYANGKLQFDVSLGAGSGGVLLDCTVIGVTGDKARATTWKVGIANNRFEYYSVGDTSIELGRDLPLPIVIKKQPGQLDAAVVFLTYIGGNYSPGFRGCTVTPLV